MRMARRSGSSWYQWVMTSRTKTGVRCGSVEPTSDWTHQRNRPMKTLKWHTWRAMIFLAALGSSALVLEAGKRWF